MIINGLYNSPSFIKEIPLFCRYLSSFSAYLGVKKDRVVVTCTWPRVMAHIKGVCLLCALASTCATRHPVAPATTSWGADHMGYPPQKNISRYDSRYIYIHIIFIYIFILYIDGNETPFRCRHGVVIIHHANVPTHWLIGTYLDFDLTPKLSYNMGKKHVCVYIYIYNSSMLQ